MEANEVDVGYGRLIVGAITVAQLSRFAVPWQYRQLFRDGAKAYRVDENLLHAIAWQESRMNPAAVSPPNTNGTRDYGLMQINESNFTTLGLTAETALDPVKSVNAAAQLLKGIHAKGVTFLPDVAAAYNAGRVKLRGDGAYINAEYVLQLMARYTWVQIAALAPLQ